MKKVLAIVLALITFTVIFTGCTQAVKQPAAAPQETVAPPVQNEKPKDGAAGKIVTEAVDAQGKLNGWIDGNSVEIQMTPSDAAAFWVADVKGQMEGIKDGDMVKFSYKQNEQGQMVITKIEKQ